MKSNFQRVVNILEDGGSVKISTGHKIVMDWEGHICVEAVCGSDPVLLDLDFSLNTFVDECNKLTDQYLVSRTPVKHS